jgi:SPP1 gp7 family putative phage head morphogenesis protein
MLKDKPMQALIGETNRALGNAVDHGLKGNMPPADMVSKLQHDVFVFSACKTHIELKEVGSHLVDENGKIKSYQKFSQDVDAIHKLYNENHLQAEYIFATSSAEMSAKWNQFAKDGDRYNLQYRTAGDTKVRDSHAEMAGITLPVSDPFWNSYFPPNGWRCRCTTVQVLKDKYPVDNSTEAIKKADAATVQIDSKGRDRGEMFRFNPGKQQVIFPPNHPYYKVKQAISNIITATDKHVTLQEYIQESRKQFHSFDENWKKEYFNEKTGGFYVSHTGHFFNSEGGKYERVVGKQLADTGERIQFLQEGLYKRKTPDLFMKTQTWDIKAIESYTSNAIMDHIWEGKKADNVLFYFTQEINVNILKEGYDRALGRFKKFGKLKTLPGVYYMKNGILTKFK